MKEFCKKYNLSEAQFYGLEKIEDSLDLDGLTSIPNGFNPTVGGSLYLRNGLECKKQELGNQILSWQDGKYIKFDGIFTEVLSKNGDIYRVKNLNSGKEFYLVSDGKFHAHGDTISDAIEDLRFKIAQETLKSKPINMESLIKIERYRAITGACNLGVNDWIKVNFKKEEVKMIIKRRIKVKDLLPILERTNAYGIENFKKLIQN